MNSFHFLDWAVVIGYFAVVLFLGRLASRGVTTGDSFFLAGRKLGRVYQFFLNFGNSADATGAVSTSSIVYQQGASGIWVGFQMIFLNPYYWFMYSWFRRVRLTTMADLFTDRLGSRRLALAYASFQIIMTIAVTIGFGNLVSYKIAAALVSKPEVEWSATERQSVENYRELKVLESATPVGGLTPVAQQRLDELRERNDRGELKNHITALNPWMFYCIYTLVVGLYIVQGGMAAAAINEAFQGVLIVVFSAILIPTGLAAIGGWDQLAATVPASAFDLFGNAGVSEFTGWTVAAVFFATIVQTHAGPANMGIAGSAKNESTARFGAVSGTFGKRLTTIMWAFCGLIAISLLSGANSLADADMVWGTMSRQLLGPGLLGLMFAGVLAAQMSTIAAQAMSASALFARNVYGSTREASDRDLVRVGRFALVVILILGTLVSTQINDVYSILQFALTMNVPFGASILLMFIWRRTAIAGVWAAVIGSAFINILFPLVAHKIDAIAYHPTFVARSVNDAGRAMPVYFESVVRVRPADNDSALEGRGRFHTELVLVRAVGVDPADLSAGGRLACRFFIDGLLPVLLVVFVSLFSRRPDQARVDQFFGRLKTPVGDTPELEAAAIAATKQDPHRFNHLKLLPNSSLEFTKWTREDAVGFSICCGVTLAIIGLFWGLLRMAAG